MSLYLDTTPEELKKRFFSLDNPRDVARLVEVKYEHLVYHIYKLKTEEKYERFEVPKKSGGVRQISAPITALKIIQQKLNQVLQAVYLIKPQVHSFVAGKSIVTNAKAHSKKQVVLNLDLLNFFPSIHFGRVRGMFMGKPYDRNDRVASVLAKICALYSELPQGAPTSPIISNMICGQLDSQLLRYANHHYCYYTRYADDITISTYRPGMPKDLVRLKKDGSVRLGKDLEEIITGNGFTVNYSKIRMFSKNRRQEVNGLTVNRFPNVRKGLLSQVRAMLHAWDVHGYENAQNEYWEIYDKKYRSRWTQSPSFERVVRGKIEFIGMVRGKSDPKYLRFIKQYSELYKLLHPEFEIREEKFTELLNAYDEMKEMKDYQRRGYLFEEFLKRFFAFSNIEMKDPFTRNDGAEQIDGSFLMDGWFYLVEARWRKDKANIREIDGLTAQVSRSGDQTMGIFIHVNGWSNKVPGTMKQNPVKKIVLVNGKDIEICLKNGLELRKLLIAKLEHLNTRAEPFLSATEYFENNE